MNQDSHPLSGAQRCFAVMPAAGIGSRMATELPKQYLTIAGKTIIEHSLNALLACPWLEQVWVGLRADDQTFAQLPIAGHAKLKCYQGGAERSDTVLAALEQLSAIANDDDWVLVHDAARPCVSQTELKALHDAMPSAPYGAILALPVVDTVKRANQQQQILKTVPRDGLYRALTPQLFPYGLLKSALETADKSKVTDEASAVEQLAQQPLLVIGQQTNLKITNPEDFALAELILSSRN
jgi:2-C-methyl-D-erythritol 4-phosphate cytidylyltransferase